MIPQAVSSASTATAAIRLASARQGIDFNYLLNQAKTESGLDPNAAAPTSSARGLFQFTAATWLETIRRHGREHGLGDAEAALDSRATLDSSTRTAILDLRRDPFASADMAASYAADNATKLSTRLGRAATATDLYLAHLLGAAGAIRFLKADPSAPASAINPAAARANPRIFFAADGSPKSVEQVHDHFAAVFGGKPVPATGTALPITRQPALQLAAAPDAARMAYLLLAELSA